MKYLPNYSKKLKPYKRQLLTALLLLLLNCAIFSAPFWVGIAELDCQSDSHVSFCAVRMEAAGISLQCTGESCSFWYWDNVVNEQLWMWPPRE